MIHIGIDPGKKGAMAIISGDGISVYAFDETAYNSQFAEIVKKGDGVRCCLEHVGAMPGQGVTSMFSFGDNFGFIRGLLTAHNIPYELVRPQKWKKEYSITADKNSAITVCSRLFPDVSLLPTSRCRKPSDGFAEALLMAEYARRHMK